MRVAVIVLLVLLISPDVLAGGGSVWTGKKVGVFDYTSPMWRPSVEAMVAEFNRILPKDAPRLDYRFMPERACNEIAPRRHKRGIVVCSAASLPDEAYAVYKVLDGRFVRGTIMLSDFTFSQWIYDDMAQVLCHEFMHLLTNIDDAKGMPRPDTSCVHGELTLPGPFDVAHIRKVYGKKKSR